MRLSVSGWVRATALVALALAASGCAADHTSYKVGDRVYEDGNAPPARKPPP